MMKRNLDIQYFIAVRRAQLRAELDAYYVRLYGFTHNALRYILNLNEVCGKDFPLRR